MSAESVTPVILVVEDEIFIRWNAVEMVSDAGWEALEAGCADEAFKILAGDQPVDVLFTDVNMPGSMDGLDLAWRVHELKPDIQIVVTTGKTFIPREQMPGDGTFLPKPYGITDLQRIVEAKVYRQQSKG